MFPRSSGTFICLGHSGHGDFTVNSQEDLAHIITHTKRKRKVGPATNGKEGSG